MSVQLIFCLVLDDIGVCMAVTGEQISSSDALHLDLIDCGCRVNSYSSYKQNWDMPRN